jgi:outer membrane protein assembly factor BamB
MTMTCEDCGATWRRSARFCGRCGAVLRATPRAADAPSRGATPRLPRWLIAAVAACCLVVLGGVALVIGEPWETLQAAPSQDVEVPTSPEGTVPEGDRRRDAVWDRPEPAVLCQPAPCERWRLHLPSGTSVVDDDTAYHVGRTDWRVEVTAIDLDTGSVRWRETLLVPDAVNGPPIDGLAPMPLLGWDETVFVATDGLIEARSRADGAVIWTFDREGLLPFSLRLAPSDTVVVFAGWRGQGGLAETGWSRETILAIDATTGDLRWEREVEMSLSHGELTDGLILTLTDQGSDGSDDATADLAEDPTFEGEAAPEDSLLMALDVVTGEAVWQQPTPRHGFGISGSVLRVYDQAEPELWDLRTGESMQLPLPDGFHETSDIEVVGDLVVARSFPDDDVSDGFPMESLQHLTVFNRVDGAERFTGSAPGWVEMATLTDGGVVIASGDADLLRLTALEPDGATRWDLKFGLPTATSWPRWPRVLADGTITIIATLPGASDLALHRIDAGSGETLSSFHLDVDVGDVEPHDLEARWPLVIDHGSVRDGMRIHGPAGSLQLTRHAEILSVDPLVIQTPTGTLVRLDEELLLGAS